ncbi:nitroreductase family deazaflavin-dependent oxidoreductase [Cryptosporangium minutisporangium]
MTEGEQRTSSDDDAARSPIRYRPKRWMYRGGRPHWLARTMNTLSAWLYARGWLTSGRGAVLEVRGRRSGTKVAVPVVIADYEGCRYLVSMLGARANWVLNVQAADGTATLVHNGEQVVHLVEVPIDDRPPILRRYLEVAPGARPHIPVARTAPLSDFRRVAERYPVFRIDDRP